MRRTGAERRSARVSDSPVRDLAPGGCEGPPITFPTKSHLATRWCRTGQFRTTTPFRSGKRRGRASAVLDHLCRRLERQRACRSKTNACLVDAYVRTSCRTLQWPYPKRTSAIQLAVTDAQRCLPSLASVACVDERSGAIRNRTIERMAPKDVGFPNRRDWTRTVATAFPGGRIRNPAPVRRTLAVLRRCSVAASTCQRHASVSAGITGRQ